MSFIDEKIESFQENCYMTAKMEAEEMEKEIDKEIEESIKTEIEKYEEEIQKNFDRKVVKLEKNYNSELFNQEAELKQKVINKKQEMKEKIKKEIYNKINEFVNTQNYENFLFNNIEQSIKNCKGLENDVVLSITQRDYDKYKEKIEKRFSCNLTTIENSNIGGSICKNKNVVVDNTLNTLIEENL